MFEYCCKRESKRGCFLTNASRSATCLGVLIIAARWTDSLTFKVLSYSSMTFARPTLHWIGNPIITLISLLPLPDAIIETSLPSPRRSPFPPSFHSISAPIIYGEVLAWYPLPTLPTTHHNAIFFLVHKTSKLSNPPLIPQVMNSKRPYQADLTVEN
jgi:hypothetical protein